MTRQQAEYLASQERDYVARKMHGEWIVWCSSSDHVVEYDVATIAKASQPIPAQAASNETTVYVLETIYTCADNVIPNANTPKVEIIYDPKAQASKFTVRVNGLRNTYCWALSDAVSVAREQIEILKAEQYSRLMEMAKHWHK